jgi:hypothetical protein
MNSPAEFRHHDFPRIDTLLDAKVLRSVTLSYATIARQTVYAQAVRARWTSVHAGGTIARARHIVPLPGEAVELVASTAANSVVFHHEQNRTIEIIFVLLL